MSVIDNLQEAWHFPGHDKSDAEILRIAADRVEQSRAGPRAPTPRDPPGRRASAPWEASGTPSSGHLA